MVSILAPCAKRLHPWILATRPRTLPAAMAPVLAASALAWRYELFEPITASLCLAFALTLQIATNLANDYYDFIRGADTEARLGPTRAVAAGLIEPRDMKKAMYASFTLSFAVGMMLVPYGLYGGWWLVLVGICCLASGYAYTAGPFPLGYLGLGEIFVMLFFGGVAVCCTFYLQAGFISCESLFLATGIGSLSAGLLVVNNHRDMETDRRARKRTLAVRFGSTFSLWEYRLLLIWAYVACLAMVYLMKTPWPLLPLLTSPMAYRLATGLGKASTGKEFNRLLARTATLLTLYSLLLSLSFIPR